MRDPSGSWCQDTVTLVILFELQKGDLLQLAETIAILCAAGACKAVLNQRVRLAGMLVMGSAVREEEG